MSESLPTAENDVPRRRDCPKCGGYQFLSVAGVWRHWPQGPDWNATPPVECPIPPGNGADRGQS